VSLNSGAVGILKDSPRDGSLPDWGGALCPALGGVARRSDRFSGCFGVGIFHLSHRRRAHVTGFSEKAAGVLSAVGRALGRHRKPLPWLPANRDRASSTQRTLRTQPVRSRPFSNPAQPSWHSTGCANSAHLFSLGELCREAHFYGSAQRKPIRGGEADSPEWGCQPECVYCRAMATRTAVSASIR
jgi:hypothetical protein